MLAPYFAVIKRSVEKMPHMVKIHGGSMYGNWANAAMALHRLEGLKQDCRPCC
jgi:hypothetical protein